METTGLILQLPQPLHVIYPLPEFFDMPVKHGRIGSHAQFMRRLMNFNPLLTGTFIGIDLFPDGFVKYSSSPAGHLLQTCFLQPSQTFFKRNLCLAENIFHFHRGQRFNMKFGSYLPDAFKQRAVKVQILLWVYPANNMNLGYRLAVISFYNVPDLFRR